MNHIAASAPPRQQTGLSIVMGQDHPSLVLVLAVLEVVTAIAEFASAVFAVVWAAAALVAAVSAVVCAVTALATAVLAVVRAVAALATAVFAVACAAAALTPSELRVALALLEGKTPGAIAPGQGVSLATVRTHLSRLYHKTDTGGQASLVVAQAAAMPSV